MVICRLSALLGERRLKVADVVRDTGIARATVDRYYYDSVQSYDRDILEKLCVYLKVDLPSLLQYVREPDLFDAPQVSTSAGAVHEPPQPYYARPERPASRRRNLPKT
jgi:putative transcriptional regulator